MVKINIVIISFVRLLFISGWGKHLSMPPFYKALSLPMQSVALDSKIYVITVLQSTCQEKQAFPTTGCFLMTKHNELNVEFLTVNYSF